MWVEKCDRCASVKKPPRNPRAPLGQMPIGAPMGRLATDILGLLPLTLRGNHYILLVTDHSTKWVEIFVVPDQTVTTCAEVISNEVTARFGCPLNLTVTSGRIIKAKSLLNYASCWTFGRPEPHLEIQRAMARQSISMYLAENDKSLPQRGAEELGQAPWLPGCSILRNTT